MFPWSLKVSLTLIREGPPCMLLCLLLCRILLGFIGLIGVPGVFGLGLEDSYPPSLFESSFPKATQWIKLIENTLKEIGDPFVIIGGVVLLDDLPLVLLVPHFMLNHNISGTVVPVE